MFHGEIQHIEQTGFLDFQNIFSLYTVKENECHTVVKNLTNLDNLSSFYWILKILHKISIEAMICGYLEPKKLRARPPNEAVTPS